jgi:hypothetical protein
MGRVPEGEWGGAQIRDVPFAYSGSFLKSNDRFGQKNRFRILKSNKSGCYEPHYSRTTWNPIELQRLAPGSRLANVDE